MARLCDTVGILADKTHVKRMHRTLNRTKFANKVKSFEMKGVADPVFRRNACTRKGFVNRLFARRLLPLGVFKIGDHAVNSIHQCRNKRRRSFAVATDPSNRN